MEERISHIIYGRNPLREALQADLPLEKIFFQEGNVDRVALELRDLANSKKIPFSFVTRQRLDHMTNGAAHQGVVARQSLRSYATVEELLEVSDSRKEAPFLLACFQLQDPHNLGSLMRTAESVGVHGIIIPKKKSVGLTPTVSKVAAGADNFVRLARVSDLASTMRDLKSRGLTVVGAHPGAGQDYWEADLKGPMVILLGGEGRGLDSRLLSICDILVHIPHAGRINSLNVGVAGALILYEVMRKRLKRD